MPALPMADRLAVEIESFLYALDRGDFGDLRIGEHESAYVRGLRAALADYETTDRSLISTAHDRGAEIAAEFPDYSKRSAA